VNFRLKDNMVCWDFREEDDGYAAMTYDIAHLNLSVGALRPQGIRRPTTVVNIWCTPRERKPVTFCCTSSGQPAL